MPGIFLILTISTSKQEHHRLGLQLDLRSKIRMFQVCLTRSIFLAESCLQRLLYGGAIVLDCIVVTLLVLVAFLCWRRRTNEPVKHPGSDQTWSYLLQHRHIPSLEL